MEELNSCGGIAAWRLLHYRDPVAVCAAVRAHIDCGGLKCRKEIFKVLLSIPAEWAHHELRSALRHLAAAGVPESQRLQDGFALETVVIARNRGAWEVLLEELGSGGVLSAAVMQGQELKRTMFHAVYLCSCLAPDLVGIGVLPDGDQVADAVLCRVHWRPEVRPHRARAGEFELRDDFAPSFIGVASIPAQTATDALAILEARFVRSDLALLRARAEPLLSALRGHAQWGSARVAWIAAVVRRASVAPGLW